MVHQLRSHKRILVGQLTQHQRISDSVGGGGR